MACNLLFLPRERFEPSNGGSRVISPWSDRQAEERARYDFLLRLYQVTRSDPERVWHGGDVGGALGLSLPQSFAVVEFLADQGYVDYLGAGPRIRIAPRGIRYIEWEAVSRQTIR